MELCKINCLLWNSGIGFAGQKQYVTIDTNHPQLLIFAAFLAGTLMFC